MTDEKKIKEVLEEFDFDKVQKVTNFLNWKWANNDDTISIPSSYRLIEEAKRLLYYCKKEKDNIVTISAGGFIAHKDKDENGESYYTLSFIIEESSNS